jgi:hypothetical protein
MAEALLIFDILVRGDHHIETVALGSFDQIPVLEFVPAHLQRRPDIMAGQDLAKTTRGVLVEENLQA